MDLQKIKLIDELSDDAIIDAEDLSVYLGISHVHVRWLNSQNKSALPEKSKIFGRLIRYRMGEVRAFVRDPTNREPLKPDVDKNISKLGRPTKKEIIESSKRGISVSAYRESGNE